MANAIRMSMYGSSLLLLLSSLLVVSRPQTHVPVETGMRSFSSAIKGGHLPPGEEYLLYEADSGPGVITEQWYTGENCMNENTTIRIYIDGEKYPSIEFLLLLGHGIGFVDANTRNHAPWNTKRISADANSNVYNTYQIPFSKSFQVTATDPAGGVFWYIIRGVYNYPLIFGDLQLPSSARLRLYKNVKVDLLPFEFIDLVDVHNSAGALFQVTLAASSSDFTYLEGCMRAYIDGNNTTFLSSGTEDFFLSAFYYNNGLFHSDNSGLTYKADPGTMSAYKFFEDDPVLFTKSFRLRWRCGEIVGTGYEECPNVYFEPSTAKTLQSDQLANKTKIISSPNVDITTVTTYAWVYEW